jgi:hypothetical protein
VTSTQISSGYLLTDQPHPDEHCIVPDPGFNGTSNKKVYVCNDGGIFRTDDITTAGTSSGWVNLNHGYQTTQYYGAVGNGTTGLIYGGLQDNGSLTLPGTSSTANLTFGGDGGFTVIDSTDENYAYGEYTSLQLHRTTNHGASAQYIWQGLPDAGTNANFIAPFILDPNNQSRMLAGGRSIWRSDNVKTGNPPSWVSIRPAGSDVISALAIAESNSNIIWAVQNDGKIYKTNNGLDGVPIWQTIDDNASPNPLPNRYPTRIVIDKDNPNIVIVAFGGFNDGNLQRTIDGGQNWADITGTGTSGLPFAPIRGVARHPSDPNSLYVGTDVGIFASADKGLTWSTMNEGPASVAVDELTFMKNSTTLLAATHGRGVWTIRLDKTPFDFDGDRKTDISIFRPAPGEWWYLKSSTGGNAALQFGTSSDKITPGDFTGDGKTDIAFFRPASGFWFILRSEDFSFFSFPFGANGDVPVPADYDGDGRADPAVFRPSTNTWFISNTGGGGTTITNFGASGDRPVAADYDGDGKADIAIFRPSDGSWWYVRSIDGSFRVFSFGAATDKCVPGDYTGDGRADIAIFRPSTGFWFIQRSEDNSYFSFPFGASGDVPVPGDYDGDGRFDTAVFRPSNSTWFLNQTTAGVGIVGFGIAGDLPVPNAFVP